MSLYVSGTENPIDEPTIPVGQRLYPFAFQMPHNLPSSYESTTGYVRYSAKCKIDVPWGFDYETERRFSVVSIYDLNQVSWAVVSYNVSGRPKKSSPLLQIWHSSVNCYMYECMTQFEKISKRLKS